MTEHIHTHCPCTDECAHEHHHGHGEHELHHGHHHEHHHDHAGIKGQLARIIVSTSLLLAAYIIERHANLAAWQLLLVYLVPYLAAGGDTLKEAAEGLVHGNPFNEHFLMSIATIGALCIACYTEAVFVMLFFQVGEMFEGYAEGRSKESISHLMDIRPDSANVERDGGVFCVSPDEVSVGETIVIRPGEKIPLDAVVLEGATSVNTVALTGESLPREVTVGDEIVSGCVNISGVVRARTTKTYGESTVSKIIDLVENASNHKSRSETFISRFARVYTPVVVFAAVILALLPPLLSGHFSATFTTWLYRALLFLVVSCPCALVISVPLSFFGGVGGAARDGVLIKGANYIDTLAKLSTVVFDKTGTLTHGQFTVVAVHPESCDEHRLLHLAAHVEHYSTHPIGTALRDAFPDEAVDGCSVTDVQETAGHGIKAVIEGETVCVGNSKMMDLLGVQWHDCGETGTIVHVAIDGAYAGHIVINDKVKEDSKQAIAMLKQRNVERIVMLTGDRAEAGKAVASELGIDEYHCQLLPSDKVTVLENLLNGKRSNSTLAFVGDGINDAPVLARADVGIAMGCLGSDAAIEAADVVLMDDKPSKIAIAIDSARRTVRIARQNVVFAIGVKAAVLLLAAIGVATMWMAVFADVGVTVLATLNAIRTLKRSR